MATRYSSTDGDLIVMQGKQALKKPNVVHMLKSPEEFEVQTNEGLMKGNPGDYLAHDPISGHVWPVAASYVEQHYDFLED